MTVKIFKALLFSFLLSLLGCANTDNLGELNKRFDEVKKIETLLFNQMPLPKDARISPEKSIILGEGDNWAGRIELSSSMEPLEASAFFTTEYSKRNWTLVSSTKAKLSILVFTSTTRSLTIEIKEGGPLAAKSMIVMTVAPRIQGQSIPEPKR
jgi:hypothetical protein